ncbi:MAG: radical SAM protein, partial [Anaerolineae bacterium]|nr:radical SAM protein [Anaerolineae bacterium]
MALAKQNLYRFPWSGNDNPIGWLEVTDRCNTYCRGCYRINGMQGHKTLEQVKEEIQLLKKWRNCDNISIAGGEPLIHPEILDIIHYIYSQKMKPLILTNGIEISKNPGLVKELKKAGAIGFTFHIDSEQQRPHWKGKSETDLFELRQYFADLVHDVGGMFVSFGMTVYPGNIEFVPELVRWANKNIDRVNGLVFITFRNASLTGNFDYFAGGRRIDLQTSYAAEDDAEAYLSSEDVYNKIKEDFPHYETAAFMGGSVTHDKITWLVSAQLGSTKQMYGSAGPRIVEFLQSLYHLRFGSYFIYTKSTKVPKLSMLAGAFDQGLRKTNRAIWGDILRHPGRLFDTIHMQSIGIIQGPDLLEDGRVDMCESCPDMTVWDGRPVHSCRLD